MKTSKFLYVMLIIILLVHSSIGLSNDTPQNVTVQPIQIITSVNNPPFSFILPNGTATGLYVEFWRLWSEVNDIPIEIKMTRLEKGLSLVKNKQAIHSGLFYSEKRANWADFSIPIHQVETGILFNENYNKSLKLKQHNAIVVAVHKGSFQAEYLRKNHPDLEPMIDVDNELIFNQLLKNEVDVIVAEIPFLKSQLASRGLNGVFSFSDEILISNLVHALIAKGQPELLNLVNSGIENIPVQSIIELEKKWLPTVEPFFKQDKNSLFLLTSKEKKWLQKYQNLSLGSDSSWYPFDFSDKDGNFTGIAADYIKHISASLNINFKPVKNESWKDLLDKTIAGEVDVMAAVAITEEREKVLKFTQPYFKAPIVIVTNKNSFYADNMKSLSGKTLGIVKGFAMNDWISKDFPEINIVPVNSIVEGLEKVNAGEIDAYTGAIAVINYEMKNRKLYNLQISGFAPYDFEISIAVRKGLEPLVPILNKILSNMSENQKAAIANNWLSVRIDKGTPLSKIMLFISPILISLMLVIFIVMRFNKRLKNEITNRIKVEKKLTHLAQHDELTGLANWRLFEQLSTEALMQSTSNNEKQAFLFLDIDGFKSINDSYGHKIGDLLLIAIAKRLKECLIGNQKIARLGGDEFVIYLSDNISEKQTHLIALKLLKALAKPYMLEEIQVSVSASIGISIAPQDGKDLESLIKKADNAMYKAKDSGKNTYRHYS